MSAVQPDLFGDFDRAQEAKRLWEQPHTCPSCGTEERNGYLLQMNHGVNPETGGVAHFPPGRHPIYGSSCVAQHLVTNHIRYAVRHDDEQMLTERIERGRALRLDVDAIVAAARQEAS